MSTTSATDAERILAVLYSLDDETAERMLLNLAPELAGKLRGMLADFSRNPPSLKKQQRILEDFESYFRFAIKFSNPKPTLKLHRVDPDADALEEYSVSDNGIRDLEEMNISQVTSALEEESPRTAAILMKELNSERNAGIFNLMQPSIRDAVVRELSTDPRVPSAIVAQIARTTAARAVTLPTDRPEQPDPIQRIADVLRVTEKTKQREILVTLRQQEPDVCMKVQKLLYRFEDLKDLEDHKVRAVLSKVDTGTLSIALFGASDSVLGKVKTNLSKRARTTLEEEMGFLGNVSDIEVKQSHETVVEKIAEVEMEGT